MLQESDLIGAWGFDTGFNPDRNGTTLTFSADGSGVINPDDDPVPFLWKLVDNGLTFSVNNHWMGPFRIRIEERDLPLGRFRSLISESPLLPFGLRQFQAIPKN